jgi:hypothetical protein
VTPATSEYGNGLRGGPFPSHIRRKEIVMSAPRTNIEKQKRRHWAPLAGMALVVLFGVGLILYWIFEEAATAPENIGEQPRPILAPPGAEAPTEADAPGVVVED